MEPGLRAGVFASYPQGRGQDDIGSRTSTNGHTHLPHLESLQRAHRVRSGMTGTFMLEVLVREGGGEGWMKMILLLSCLLPTRWKVCAWILDVLLLPCHHPCTFTCGWCSLALKHKLVCGFSVVEGSAHSRGTHGRAWSNAPRVDVTAEGGTRWRCPMSQGRHGQMLVKIA